ncbi:DUF1515 domain-containing protein [Mesorhizobium sp. M7A.F.Ca.MR.245.00.0.0]|nr:DUF1515 domain-containing protein [Mesorhizobium sp. M7A.F.Ca.MR.245.00.0.0]
MHWWPRSWPTTVRANGSADGDHECRRSRPRQSHHHQGACEMTSKLDEISEAIGSLRAEVAGIRRDFQASEQRSVESSRRADLHRAAVHKRVDDLVAEVGELRTNVETMKTDVADSKTITDEVKEWKQRGVGALFVAGIAGTAIGGAAVGFVVYWWDAIMKVLRAA